MPRSGRALVAIAVAAVLALAAVSAARAEKLHTVSPGETLSYLSQVYAVTVGEIVDLNGIPDPNRIFSGEVLRIPGFSGGGNHAVTPPAAAMTYEAQPGDTLSGIAETFGVSLQELMAANALRDPDFVGAGQALAIPAAARAPMPAARR